MISVSSGLQTESARLFRSFILSLFVFREKLFLFKNARSGKKYFSFALWRDFVYHFVSRVKR